MPQFDGKRGITMRMDDRKIRGDIKTILQAEPPDKAVARLLWCASVTETMYMMEYYAYVENLCGPGVAVQVGNCLRDFWREGR